jgi:hypothetical protein
MNKIQFIYYSNNEGKWQFIYYSNNEGKWQFIYYSNNEGKWFNPKASGSKKFHE